MKGNKEAMDVLMEHCALVVEEEEIDAEDSEESEEVYSEGDDEEYEEEEEEEYEDEDEEYEEEIGDEDDTPIELEKEFDAHSLRQRLHLKVQIR